MQFGICTDPENAAVVATAGFNYIEINIQQTLIPEAGERQFSPNLARIKSCGLPILAANCLIPGHLKITGPVVRMDELTRYVTTAFQRARMAGVETIVFGSSGARNVPDGFDRKQAYDQLVAFGVILAAVAERFGLMIAVEPLNRVESNILNTVREAAKYVRDVNQPSFRLLVDAYHWARENEAPETLVEVAGLLQHAHIATYPARQPPGTEATDFSAFFLALQQGQYDKRLSVEADWHDLKMQAPAALKDLHRYVKMSRVTNE
jgi:sugar phosphate isomerase/epimerase